jgi:BirA family biotin operon repressor/biotin-[acetyl-CoA-carboxylase] ligase
LAPFGDGLCLSVGWRFAQAPSNLSSLGLAVGVGLLRGMKRLGLDDVELKWPNDLLRSGGKLAGILIEVSGEAEGPLHVIVGVGINYRISVATGEQVRATGGVAPAAMSAATAVDAMADYQLPGRNAVIAVVIDELYGVLTAFANDGLEQFLAEWRANDFLAGKEIVVALGKQKVTGRAAGITPDGQLQVATEKGVQHVLGGDVSVRARA